MRLSACSSRPHPVNSHMDQTCAARAASSLRICSSSPLTRYVPHLESCVGTRGPPRLSGPGATRGWGP
ncbi:unnamed protein product [Lota lota]